MFITTSRFSHEARRYAEQVPNSLVLIDGPQLAALMIESVGEGHHPGATTLGGRRSAVQYRGEAGEVGRVAGGFNDTTNEPME